MNPWTSIEDLMAVSLYDSWMLVRHLTGLITQLCFKQLGVRGVPGYVLRILIYWYTNQDICV